MNRWIFEPNGWENNKVEGELKLYHQDNVRLDDGDQKVSFNIASQSSSSYKLKINKSFIQVLSVGILWQI